MKTLLKSLNANPKRLFLIDGFGAILSAVMLGLILTRFESLFGIPRTALYILAILPIFFALYDFYCYWAVEKNLSGCLRRIAYVNLFYCGLSIGFAIYHSDKITYLGWAYILGELAIVISLAITELKVAKAIDI